MILIASVFKKDKSGFGLAKVKIIIKGPYAYTGYCGLASTLLNIYLGNIFFKYVVICEPIHDVGTLLSCQPRVTAMSCFVYNCLVKH